MPYPQRRSSPPAAGSFEDKHNESNEHDLASSDPSPFSSERSTVLSRDSMEHINTLPSPSSAPHHIHSHHSHTTANSTLAHSRSLSRHPSSKEGAHLTAPLTAHTTQTSTASPPSNAARRQTSLSIPLTPYLSRHTTRHTIPKPKIPPPPAEERAKYEIKFDDEGGKDPWNPQNWSARRKFVSSSVATYSCFCSTYASSAFSANTRALSEAFHVSTEVTTLGTSLFIAGYALGPGVWGPWSELSGRRIPITVASFGFLLFAAGAATGKDLQTVLLCRFWGGVMGSCPLSVVAGVLGDVYNQSQRGVAISLFAATLILGPITAPFIGGFTVMNENLGWRFNGYWIVIVSAIGALACIFLLEETYAPVLLSNKAKQLRKETGNWALYAKHDEMEITVRDIVTKYFTRPVKMLVTEPVLFCVSFYMSFVYGLLYLSFTAYPLIFQGVHKMNPGVGSLPLFSIGLGTMIACAWTILDQPSYDRKMAANNGRAIPEWRLPQVMVGGCAFAIGLFWFGWTGNSANTHWAAPAAAGIVTGFGIISIFMPLLNYLIDSYLMLAASAMSANTIMRSSFAAAFPMFGTYMYEGLGIGKATTVLACVATGLIPVPVLFWFYGARLRQKSKYAPTFPPPSPPKRDEEMAVGEEKVEHENEKIEEEVLRRPSVPQRLSKRLSGGTQRRSEGLLDVGEEDSLENLIKQRYKEMLK